MVRTDEEAIADVNKLLKDMGNNHLTAADGGVRGKGGDRLFTLECSECKQDPELYGKGLFTSTKSNLKKGAVPCGCSSGFKFNDEQEILDCNRLLHKMDNTHLKVVGVKGRQGGVRVFELACGVCTKDPELYPEAFTSMKYNLKSSTPCGCSPRYKWSAQQYETLIQRKMTEDGHVFQGFVGDKKVNTYTKFNWTCNEGHPCKTSIDNYLHKGTRCSTCATYGYDRNKDASLYIVRWDYPNADSFIKIGITNYPDVKTRITQQQRETDYTPTIIETTKGDGSMIADLERDIKTHFKGSLGISSEIFGDGHTECLPVEMLDTLLSYIKTIHQ